MSEHFRGKVAVVTGGASGMGRAMALALAERGADVAIGSLTSTDPAPGQSVHLVSGDDGEEVAKEIRSHGVTAMWRPLDVGETESVTSFVAEVRRTLGRIDILVNAAGSSGRHPLMDHPDELWERMLNVNLSGAYRTSKACFPDMVRNRWGRIVHIASTAANVGASAHAAYCAAKSGLLGLSRCIALEGAPFAITSNVINPGFVATQQNSLGMLEQMKLDEVSLPLEEYRERIAQTIPQRRWVEVGEIAAAAVFLCQESSLGITGESITVAAGSHW